MKKIFYFTIFVLVFSKCKKDTSLPEPEHFYYYLSKEQLNKTPYFTNPKFDTLTFISNKNDTLVFAKAGTDTSWYETSDLTPSGYGDKIYHYQQLRNSYTTLKGEGKFEVLHGRDFFAFDRRLKELLSFRFNNHNLFIQDYFLGVDHNGVIDSIFLNNKFYFQVSEIFNNWQDSTSARAYINLEYGVFHVMDLTKNKTWTLSH